MSSQVHSDANHGLYSVRSPSVNIRDKIYCDCDLWHRTGFLKIMFYYQMEIKVINYVGSTTQSMPGPQDESTPFVSFLTRRIATYRLVVSADRLPLSLPSDIWEVQSGVCQERLSCCIFQVSVFSHSLYVAESSETMSLYFS